jgi:hypothetical protein
MEQRVRRGLEVGIGLAVLGVQRWMSVRPEVEAELERLGLGPAAELSRHLGDTVMSAVTRLTGGAPPR